MSKTECKTVYGRVYTLPGEMPECPDHSSFIMELDDGTQAIVFLPTSFWKYRQEQFMIGQRLGLFGAESYRTVQFAAESVWPDKASRV